MGLRWSTWWRRQAVCGGEAGHHGGMREADRVSPDTAISAGNSSDRIQLPDCDLRQVAWQQISVHHAVPIRPSDLTFRINAVDLENRLGDVETDCRDRLHAWLLQIVGALTAHTFMALTCRWRSRPQHHKRTSPTWHKPWTGGSVRQIDVHAELD